MLICKLDAGLGLTLTGSRVDRWADQSGYGNDFATGFAGTGFNPSFDQTLFGGKGGVHFAGANNFLESVQAVIQASMTSYSVIVVCNRKPGPNPYLLNDKTNGLLFGWGLGDQMGVNTQSNSQFASPRNQTIIYGISSNSLGRTYYLNGKSYPEFWTAGAYASNAPLGVLQLGAVESGGGATVDIAEVYLYHTALCGSQMRDVISKLIAKYGIICPVKPSINAVFVGNSIMQGYYSSSLPCVPDTIAQLGYGSQDYANLGRSADYLALLIDEAQKYGKPLYNPNLAPNRNIAVIWEISNSLTDSAAVVSTIESQLVTLCKLYRTYGFRVIVADCLPRTLVAGQNPNFEANRITINAWLAANYAGFADGYVPLGTNAHIGLPGSNANTTYFFTDGVHLIDAGHHEVATGFAAAIQSILEAG